MSTSAAKAWNCSNCSAPNGQEELYCPICMYGRPMDKKDVPQILHGLVVHFNGIIPRTLKHPSHSVEWRMAERHGARVSVAFDPERVSALIYRPGYERSDKVKQAVENYAAMVNCVPVNWMLDSLLQSRQIHPALYRLRAIPAVAQPTVKGNNLPHHQHPFYVMNCDEYALFPIQRDTPARALLPKGAAGAVEEPPKSRDIPALQWTRTGVWEAALEAAKAKDTKGGKDASGGGGDFDDNSEKAGRGIELLRSAKNKCNPALFSGLTFALSEGLSSDAAVISTLKAFGGAVLTLPTEPNALTAALDDSNATHVLFHREDKKKDFMIAASGSLRPLSFVDALWAEDCLMLDELLPAEDPYVASAKLMATLSKKRAKRG